MTPLLESGPMTIDLHLGDCLDVMPTLLDGCADAIIADLPYGTTACKWDTVIPFEPLWKQYKRLIKPRGAIVLFGSQPFTSALVMSNVGWFRYEWVWYQSHSTNFLQAKKMPLKKHQNLCVFYEHLPTYNPQMRQGQLHKSRSGKPLRRRKDREETQVRGPLDVLENIETDLYYPTTVLEFGNGRRADSLHPTQKPVALLEYLIRTYTNEGDTVLDNTMGSGTTGVACVNTGRNFIGIELNAGYFAIAQQRIEAAQNEMIQTEMTLDNPSGRGIMKLLYTPCPKSQGDT